MRLLYSLTIGCSSLLLFLVQPIVAKALLPRYGGSAGVWVTSMLFFQVVLLLGYLYSYLVTRLLGRRMQSVIHAVLLILSLATVTLQLRPAPAGNPTLSIFGVLLTSIGLPYFLLSATSPLMQSWFAGSRTVAFPYWLFALSNAASLVALVSYPVLLEPALPQSEQLRLWWIGYGALVLLALAAAVLFARENPSEPAEAVPSEEERPVLWIALAACASGLWMSVANHLSQEVAPVPLLWVLPLSIYLVSFILCFEGRGWYRPGIFRVLLPLAWFVAAYRISQAGATSLGIEIATFSLALFIWCMFCHGEIARTKPATGGAFFYLMIATGGALGALLVGLAAPNLLSTYLELPISIAISVLLALHLLYGMKSTARLLRLGVVGAVAFVAASQFEAAGDVAHLRNFYGALQVSDSSASGSPIRTLFNGRTRHGIEFLSPNRITFPTAYYGPDSGAGRLLTSRANPGRVGLVGLGVGTLASYGRTGDTFRFYEINPAVIEVAKRDFHFLDHSRAKVELIEGDGRLALEKEPPGSFDVIVLDAFSGDSIPVHLLTREAFEMYFRLLRNDGVLAIHITNRYLDLEPVLRSVAASVRKNVALVHSAADPERQVLSADWAIVGAEGTAPAANVRPWTDDYSNLFQVLK